MLTFFKNKFLKWLFAAIVLLEMKFAYAESSLGQISHRLLEPVGLFTKTLYNICYILGTMLLVGSVIQYRDHRHHPTQVPLNRPLLLLIFGLLLIALPFIGHLSASSSFLTR